MRPTLQTALRATSLAAALVAGLSAHAATPAEMQNIKLYGDVTIAQDSVKAWGPWEQFEAPAAGNPPALPSFRTDASSLYRPIGPVNPPTPATEGTLEGFATFTKLDTNCDCEYAVIGGDQAKVRGTYSLTNTTISNLTGPSFVSGAFTPHDYVGTSADTKLALTDTGRLDFAGLAYTNVSNNPVAIPVTVEGIDSNAIQAWAFIVDYARGNTETVASLSAEGQTPIYGVVGVRTSDADIAALRAGNFTASYKGVTLIQKMIFNMTMAFGTGLFTQTVTKEIEVGKQPLVFSVSGIANGAQLSATTTKAIETGGGYYSMAVDGTLTGKNAAGYMGNVAVRGVEGTPASRGFTDSVIAQQVKLVQPTTVKTP
ncbi:hypothetical protein [Aquabacterium sp.]|uniref:hypothetical protein n=1 Tax=Aquabacterium sp. TaxID=1872578 RepID=UPI0035AD7FC9